MAMARWSRKRNSRIAQPDADHQPRQEQHKVRLRPGRGLPVAQREQIHRDEQGREQTARRDRVHHHRQQRNADDGEAATKRPFMKQIRNTPAKATRMVATVSSMSPPPWLTRAGVRLRRGDGGRRRSLSGPCPVGDEAADRGFDLAPHQADIAQVRSHRNRGAVRWRRGGRNSARSDGRRRRAAGKRRRASSCPQVEGWLKGLQTFPVSQWMLRAMRRRRRKRPSNGPLALDAMPSQPVHSVDANRMIRYDSRCN